MMNAPDSTVAGQKFDSSWEPFIPYADLSSCPPDLKPALDALIGRLGFVANSHKFYLHNAGVLRAILAMIDNISSNPDGTLDRVLRRKLAVVCSAANGCVYCTTHQCQFLTRPRAGLGEAEGWGLSMKEVHELIDGRETSSSDFERLCLEFARKASHDPRGVPDQLRARLAKVLSPAQVVELAAVVAYWKFLNTLHDCLAVPPEEQNLKFTGVLDANASAA